MEKPAFTEEEIFELSDLYGNFGYKRGIWEVMNFPKTLGYSDVHSIVIALL